MKKRIDLTGKKINNLEVLEEIKVPFSGSEKNRKSIIKLKCKCICGDIFFPYKSNVLSEKTKQCIHCSKNFHMFGKKIGSLTVLERDFSTKATSFKCLCECGRTDTVLAVHLKKGKDKRCHFCIEDERVSKKEQNRIEICIRKTERKEKRENNIENKIGMKSGKLTIVSFNSLIPRKNGQHALYNCSCECGKTTILREDNIGYVLSCGCLHKENIKAGESSPQSKLNNMEAVEIRKLFSTNLFTKRELAKKFNISETAISKVIKYETYKV